MDWASLLVGAVIGVIATIFTYEYQRWREHKKEASDRKSRVVSLLRSELNKVITSWETFKKTEEIQIDPGFSNFRYELESIAHALRNIASASETLVSKEIFNEAIEVASALTKLSHKELYMNGGKSWNEFLELGDSIVKQCKEFSQKLV